MKQRDLLTEDLDNISIGKTEVKVGMAHAVVGEGGGGVCEGPLHTEETLGSCLSGSDSHPSTKEEGGARYGTLQRCLSDCDLTKCRNKAYQGFHSKPEI